MADIHVDQLTTQNFYQIPQIFFTRVEKNYDEKGELRYKTNHTSSYADMSNDAKIAYGALYNRCMLSIRSYQEGKVDYVDENGSVFLVYTVEDLMDLLDKAKATVQKIKKELTEHGLLREVKQGANKPNRLYLQNVEADREVHEKYKAIKKKKERKVKDKVKIVYEFDFQHILTLDYLGNVIFEAETSHQNDVTNGQLNFDRPTSESGQLNSDLPDGQNLNGINKDNTNTYGNNNSSRKAEQISEEISSPAKADDPSISNQSEAKYIQPKYYSLLQVIADKYNDKFAYDYDRREIYKLTHRQKMLIGQFLADGYMTSQEILDTIERMPFDTEKPLAYLLRCLENLKEERRLEAKIAAHRNAELKYGG